MQTLAIVAAQRLNFCIVKIISVFPCQRKTKFLLLQINFLHEKENGGLTLALTIFIYLLHIIDFMR